MKTGTKWTEKGRLSVLYEHLNNDFDYLTDKTLRYYPEGKSGPSVKLLREGPEMRKEHYKTCMIFDFDGVFNKPGTAAPFEIYLAHLIDKSNYFRENREGIFHNIKMLENGENLQPYSDRLSEYFRNGELTYQSHLECCRKAADEFSITTKLPDAMKSLKNMGYEIFVLSASPWHLINFSGGRLTQIEPNNMKGTDFHFDDDGKFKNMELNLYDTRASKRDEILESSTLTKNGIEIMIDDNPKTGKKIVKSGFNHVHFWLDNTPPIPDNISVEMPELREDFSKLEQKIKKLERGFATIIMMDEEKYKDSIILAKEAVYYGKLSLDQNGTEFKDLKKRFTDRLRYYNRDMKGLFHSKKISFDMNIRDIESDNNEMSSKGKIRKLVEKFETNSLEANSKAYTKVMSLGSRGII